MQLTLVSSCTHHFLEKGYEEWLLLTDTDEFLSYNYILPGENISHFDKDSIFQGRRAPSVQKRATDRVKASLTFSEQGRGSPNNTILSFIETQRSKHEVLLLQPLQRWIEYVKSELQLHENTTD
jgi:hypothetical protein